MENIRFRFHIVIASLPSMDIWYNENHIRQSIETLKLKIIFSVSITMAAITMTMMMMMNRRMKMHWSNSNHGNSFKIFALLLKFQYSWNWLIWTIEVKLILFHGFDWKLIRCKLDAGTWIHCWDTATKSYWHATLHPYTRTFTQRDTTHIMWICEAIKNNNIPYNTCVVEWIMIICWKDKEEKTNYWPVKIEELCICLSHSYFSMENYLSAIWKSVAAIQ